MPRASNASRSSSVPEQSPRTTPTTLDGPPPFTTAPNMPLIQAHEFCGNPSASARSIRASEPGSPTNALLRSIGTSPAAKTASTGIVVVSPTDVSADIAALTDRVEPGELPDEVSVHQSGIKSR